MISTNFESRIKVNQIISNQIPEFILEENPKFLDFLKQYYLSQEFESGPSDIIENLDQYLNFDFLNDRISQQKITITSEISSLDDQISLSSIEALPKEYGLIRIEDEIITYEKIEGNTLVGCFRGFSGISSFDNLSGQEELVFTSSKSSSHLSGSEVINLSSLFLREFYKKLKYLFAPGFEDFEFHPELDINNFISNIKSFYQTKGTDESIRILFKVLFNETPKIINTEDFLIKPSSGDYLRRNIVVCDLITQNSDPFKLVGQQIKSNDNSFSGPISKIDISTKNNKTVYKIYLFYGYSDDDLIEGNFKITPKTKVTENILVGSNTITVDSTIGFENSGKFVCDGQEITYEDKSVNQFYGCSGVLNEITAGKDLYFKDYILYGYENGDLAKKVEFVVIGSLSTISGIEDFTLLNQNDIVEVGEFGSDIRYDVVDRNIKEYAFNSLVYNTRTSYNIEKFTVGSASIVLYEDPHPSSLKEGDFVDILLRDTEQKVLSNVVVNTIDGTEVTLDSPIFGILPQQKIDIRRNYEFASSKIIPLKYPKIISNVQNAYISQQNEMYIASNSLPSRELTLDIKQSVKNITSSIDIDEFFDGSLGGKYTILSFDNDVPFLTGDVVKYFYTTDSPILGLDNNSEFIVEVLEQKNKIRLYSASSFLPVKDFLRFDKNTSLGSHRFILLQHTSQIIEPENSLKKIKLNQNYDLSEKNEQTSPGIIGTLISGVSIANYKSTDRVFYGPIDRVDVSNSGFDYDVISPPKAEISSPNTGIGTTAQINLIVTGNFKDVLVDPQQFGIQRVISISARGGNGKGAVFDPILKNQYREISFSAQLTDFGGAVNPTNDTLSFKSPHGLLDGEKIVYNSNGNFGIGIGPFNGSNLDSGNYLINGGIYFSKVINSSSIQLYTSLSDLTSGINTVGFTTTNTYGIHKFRLYDPIKVLSYVRIVNPGEGYTYKSLKVKSVGIITQTDTVYFKDHKFNDGDLINYSFEGNQIEGLDINKKYYVLKIDSNNFRLCDGGLKDIDNNDTDKINYLKQKFVNLSSSGSGYQIFSYPPVEVNLQTESIGISSSIKLTPIVRGGVTGAYLYESGTDYGSTALNLNINPIVSIKKGSGAQLKPLIINGKVVSVQIQTKGSNYDQNVNLELVGSGLGGKLRAVVVDGQIESIIVLSGGVGYDINTSIIISTPGQGAVLIPLIRSLTVNDFYRYPGEFYLENKQKTGLTYSVNGYFSYREGVEFNDPDNDTFHSKILGWSRDGHPIYGPYGYTDPSNFSSEIKLLKSGYTLNSENVYNRPSTQTLPPGFFIEDYTFTNSGDLDIHNGRFSKTPEFPNGIYAYYASTKLDISTSAQTEIVPEFPYFIGNTYRSKEENDFILDQNLNLNEDDLLRNTNPYRVNRKFSRNYFLPKSFGLKQKCEIKSVESGSVDGLIIQIPGEEYSVGDKLIFDNEGTDGTGALAVIEEVFNQSDIQSINTEYNLYENVEFTWENSNTIKAKILPSHGLLDQENVEISGLSTTSVRNLAGNHRIIVNSESAILMNELNASSTLGEVSDIYLDRSLSDVSIGSSISINNENLMVLNIFENNVLRCVRNKIGISHTIGSIIREIPSTFRIKLDAKYFESKNKFIVYFNPVNSVGVGTLDGGETLITQNYGDLAIDVSIPNRSIYLPNHPFKTNDLVKLSASPDLGSASILVSNTSSGTEFALPPEIGEDSYLYVINKSKDFIGVVTQSSLTAESSGLYFASNGSDKYDYKLETVLNSTQVLTGTVSKIKTTVNTYTNHNLKNGDFISLNVIPNLSGITTLKYNSSFNVLLVNPQVFGSQSVNTVNNNIILPSHRFNTGEKVFYNTSDYVVGGISTGIYFVHKVDSNNIKLCETKLDSVSFPVNEINIQNSGGLNQEISKINPQILSIRNNDLVFDISDSSLDEYELSIFYDKSFNRNFVSTGSTSQFNVSSEGSPGLNRVVKINYDNKIPTLYYSLTKDNKSIFSNTNETDYQIIFSSSLYNQKNAVVYQSSNTSFSVSLNKIPEFLEYTDSDATINYTTTSKNVTGPISSLKLLSGGSGYKKLPRIVGVDTSASKNLPGKNAYINPSTKSIGKYKSVEISNDGFDYPSDRTLRPKANINTRLILSDNEEITEINVINGGKNFLSKPNLVLVDTLTREPVNPGILDLSLNGSSIGTIKIISRPKNLRSSLHRLYTVNNSNGISIIGVSTHIDGIVHASVRTPPIYGFVTPPFKPGDYVFVEGVEKGRFEDEFGNSSYPGDGFNSSDHGYNFFKVTEFINDPGNAVLKYDISPYTLSPGIPVRSQTTYSNAVNENSYPIFEILQEKSKFFEGESLFINDSLTDLVIKGSFSDSLTVSKTSQNIELFDKIRGASSNSQATITDIFGYDARFNYYSSTRSNLGWISDVGKLNLDTQALPDNDYYQNLSYSIKSNVEYDKYSEALNKLVHPIGTKNFGEIGFSSGAKTSIGGTSSLSTVLTLDNERRVDIIKDYDIAFDYDAEQFISSNVRLLNKKLSNFIECRSNRVLQIDDISNSFSSSEFNKDEFLESITYSVTDFYSKFLVQVSNIKNNPEDEVSYQLSDLVVLNDFRNTYTLNKSKIFTNFDLGDFEGQINNVGDPALIFSPSDPYETSYDIKVYREYFSPDNVTGFGITNYGFLRLFSESREVNGGVGISTSVFRALSADYHTIQSSSLIINTKDYSLNYYEVVGTYDGQNTHLAEYYFDSSQYFGGYSSGYIGTFGLTVDSGVINLSFFNNTNDKLIIKNKTAAIGKPELGEGTYRFLVEDQIPGSERTSRIESNYDLITGETTIKSFDSSIESVLKSTIRVSIGSTIAIYQVIAISDQVNVKLQSDPFITVGEPNGIGTFSSNTDGSIVNIVFHPDNKFLQIPLAIQSIDQFIYSEYDEFNIPDILRYGASRERIYINKYGSINNYGKDRLDFDLNWNRVPIFQKTFNPKNTNQLNLNTGVFTITNHFFEDNEELIYTPDSSLVGVAASAVGIGSTLVGGTFFTGDTIVGFSTIVGIASSENVISTPNNIITGKNIPENTSIVSVGATYSYFVGNVSSGSSVITGIANTFILNVGSNLYYSNKVQYGTIVSIGINSITSSSLSLPSGSNILYYSSDINYSATLSKVSTGTTSIEQYRVGILTDICPSTVYARKIDENNFSLTGTKNGIGFTFTNTGGGNIHKLETKKKLEKTVITVNGVMQTPLTYTPLTKTLSGNNGGLIGIGNSFISLSGISSIQPIDILKVDNEYMTVINVGFGTTNQGPISGLGTIPLCNVERGALGSIAQGHSDNSIVRIYKGSYNIVGNKIWFSEAPDGKGNNALFADNYLPLPKSTFNGRVYMRKDYSTNRIYDDISLQFTGVGRTFTLYNEGKLVSDAIPGNNILILNDIYQTPDSTNNTNNNYEILTSNGISSVRFKGITLPNTSETFTVDYDVNQNDLPKGGVLVSLAFTGGFGYAPLIGVPSNVLDVSVGVGGSISSIGFTTSIIVGLAVTGNIGVNTNIITGINTNSIKINQKVINILNKYVDEIEFVPQYRNLKIPNITDILQFDTKVTGVGIGSIFISKLTTNSTSLTTSFGFDFGDEFRGSGYFTSFEVAIDDPVHVGSAASIIAHVGSGGSITGFNIINGGSGYSAPQAVISDPTYQNLSIKGLYRPSIGNTSTTGIGLSITAISSPSESVGIGSTYSYISDFIISKPGYSFELGDKFTLSGLTTAAGLSSPLEELVFTVTEVKGDTFGAWQVGEFDYVDSIKSLQNGIRTRFPLIKDNNLLSFERSETDPAADIIDFSTILLIFINGVLQEPGVSYEYNGGTTFKFFEPPKFEDNISIFFYRGTIGVDSVEIIVYPTIEEGDSIQIKKNEGLSLTKGQDVRVISYITSSDTFETGIYLGEGIDELNPKPMDLIPQKTDVVTNLVVKYKDRDRLEPLVFPTAKIIKSFSNTDTEIFVDDAQFFKYEENEFDLNIPNFSGLIVEQTSPVSAALTATVSNSSTISQIIINDGGSGYNGVGIGNSILLKLRSVSSIGGTDAIIYATVSGFGTITSPIYISEPGFGYTNTNPPEVIAPIQPANTELVTDINFVNGFSGIITGITTCPGIGTYLGLKFFTSYDQNINIDELEVGYPLYVFNTSIGFGITSIDLNESQIISIGNTFCDNIYKIHQITNLNLTGEIICNISDKTTTSGLSTIGSSIKGMFSWGKLSSINRSQQNKLSIDLAGYTATSGLTTFPTIQRRDYGLRDLGGLVKIILD